MSPSVCQRTRTPVGPAVCNIRVLFPDAVLALGGQIEFRLVEEIDGEKRPKGKRRFETVERACAFTPPEHTHVYVAPVTRSGSKGKKGDVETVRHTAVLWADFDRKGPSGRPQTLSQAVQEGHALDLSPALIIQSGADEERGHLYWQLDEPLDVAADPDRVKRVLLGLKEAVGGDAAVAGPERLMRLPGTLNVKPEYGPRFPRCRIIPPSFKECRYSFDHIERVLVGKGLLPAEKAAAPTSKRGARSPQGGVASSEARATGDLAARLETCAFIRHAQKHAATLAEPKWEMLVLTLAGRGAEGAALAHEWSRPHPGYSEVETAKRLEYAKRRDYRPPSCSRIVEMGFACPHFDGATGGCRVLGVRSPADIVAGQRGREAKGYLQDGVTYMHTDRGPKRIAEFTVEFLRDIDANGRRACDGVLRLPGRADRPFTWEADVFADIRSLSRQLARDLGLDFQADRRMILVALDVWRAGSKPEATTLKGDFGLAVDGTWFADPFAPLPEGAPRFRAPHGGPARQLGLAVGSPGLGARTANAITDAWARLVSEREFVAAMLGLVAWSVVAPVLEANHPATVRSLLVWLGGRTGVGKATHGRIAQAFFGDFASGAAIANFGSTALSLEDAGHWFRGALMLVDDAKRSVLGPDALRAFEAFVQRAWDRSARSRLRQDGSPMPTLPIRATCLFTGEDLVLRSAAGAARLLIVQVPEPVGTPADLEEIGELLPRLSCATRSFVEWLLAEASWMERTWQEWRSAQASALSGLSSDPNSNRVAASVASVTAGFALWSAWLGAIGLSPELLT